MVFDQVMTDTALYADVVLPATTFLEHYDFAQGLRPDHLQLGRPSIEPVGEVATERRRLPRPGRAASICSGDGDPADELELMLSVLDGAAAGDRRRAPRARRRDAAVTAGAPVQFVDVFPKTPDRKVAPVPGGARREAPLGLYALSARSGDRGVSRWR